MSKKLNRQPARLPTRSDPREASVPIDKSMNVLIVDDYKTMLRIIRNLLKQIEFHNVEEASEGAEALSIMLSLFAPYTAEECWAALGGLDRVGPDGIQSVARASWPVADPALLVQETITCVVQVNGKVRDRLEVSPDITEAELRELALAASGAARALSGLGIQRVVVRPPKLVNIVAALHAAENRYHLAEHGGVVAEDRREGRVVWH